MIEQITHNIDFLTGLATVVGALFTIFKGTEVYQTRVGMKERAFIALAERAVAWQWHNYVRNATDRAASRAAEGAERVTVEGALATAKASAHGNAVQYIIAESDKAGLSNHPAIVAASNGNLRPLDAAVVMAVKRFKSGTAGLHTGPTTKGA